MKRHFPSSGIALLLLTLAGCAGVPSTPVAPIVQATPRQAWGAARKVLTVEQRAATRMALAGTIDDGKLRDAVALFVAQRAVLDATATAEGGEWSGWIVAGVAAVEVAAILRDAHTLTDAQIDAAALAGAKADADFDLFMASRGARASLASPARGRRRRGTWRIRSPPPA